MSGTNPGGDLSETAGECSCLDAGVAAAGDLGGDSGAALGDGDAAEADSLAVAGAENDIALGPSKTSRGKSWS